MQDDRNEERPRALYVQPLRRPKEGFPLVPRSLRPTLALCVSALVLLPAAAAQAQTPAPTEINGSPLNVWASVDGGIQTSVDGYASSEWYPPFSSERDPTTGETLPNALGNAGFGLIVDPEGVAGGPYRFGKQVGGSSEPYLTSGPTLAAGNPATITTTWTYPDANNTPLVEVTQVLSYTNGSRQFESSFNVRNVSSTAFSFRANVEGDLAIRGSDIGIGFLNPGPPRFVGGLNQEVGAAGGFVEETPWSAYESGPLGTVSSHTFDGASPGGFDNSLSTVSADNAAGVQWDDRLARENALPPGGVATYNLGWKFIDTLGLTPPTDSKLTGETATLSARVGDLNGAPVKEQTVHYTVTGANPLSGTVKTGSDNKATISYVGGNFGPDEITAFIDANGNNTRDENEAQAKATIQWDGPPPPVIGESAAVRTVGKGTVKVKLPPGTSSSKAKRLGLTGAASGFVKLTQATQIPMGSTLDTTKGTVNLLSDASKSTTAGKFQSGNFNGGQFRLSQSRKNPLTQLSMSGGGLGNCKTRVPKGGSAAKKRSRRLFSSVKGRFRTRGRNSSATVRGTKWTMTDTCAGTLTAVKQGSVVVHDFTLRKNKTVKAGKRYFAKAPKLRRLRK
jgi:hypothetical protein